jgi:hypothetical protein
MPQVTIASSVRDHVFSLPLSCETKRGPVNAGASNIVAKDNYCEGGHGNSIQLQQNGSISNVTFSGTTFVNSLYGGGFKSYQGLSGQISGVRNTLT